VAGVYINYLEQRCERVILYSHGNSCDLGYSLDTLFDLAYNLKINVFAYEYSGYGQSSGKKSDIEIIKCIQAAYHFLIRKGFKWHQIILYGYSIGSGPTVTLVIHQI
jgi:pimeloyl-ACP methyl ester carboxylesterase